MFVLEGLGRVTEWLMRRAHKLMTVGSSLTGANIRGQDINLVNAKNAVHQEVSNT